MSYDIFISYKNDSSGNIFAERLADDLKAMGYSVYFNSHERTSGVFGKRISSAISSCKDFICVVSKGYLSQLLDPRQSGNDWIRQELMAARDNKDHVTITPVYLVGVTKPHASDFAEGDEASFFASLDGVVMPGDSYDVSPLESLTSRLVSRREGYMDYRDVANGNPDLSANDVLRDAYVAAAQGDHEAMCRIGLMMYYGVCARPDAGAVRDFNEAYKWLSRVSEEAEDEGLRNMADMLIARMYYDGVGVPTGQDYGRSFEYHRRSEAMTYSAAQVAFMMKMGLGCPFDFSAIESYYRRLAEEGDSVAKLELGRFYESHGMYAEAERAYLSMNPISPEAHYGLGVIYARGNHTTPPVPDYQRASHHLQIAADRGNVSAMVELGHLYFRPTSGFTKDFSKALECYRMAADAGNESGQYMVGYMYEFGHVVRDVAESIRYFEMAASQGNALSASHLAILYQLPERRNYGLAYKWCAIGAEAGLSNAEFMLANMLLYGRGCQYDVAEAKRYYLRALEHGFAPAQQMLDVLLERAEPKTDYEMPSWLA